MALIICTDCSASISDKAKNCPKCGRPVKTEYYAIGIVFYLILIGIGIWLCFAFSAIPWLGIIFTGLGGIGIVTTFLRKFFTL